MSFCFWCFEEYSTKEAVILIKKDLVSKADRSSNSGINELQKAPKAFCWQIHCATTFFKSDNAAAATREKKISWNHGKNENPSGYM